MSQMPYNRPPVPTQPSQPPMQGGGRMPAYPQGPAQPQRPNTGVPRRGPVPARTGPGFPWMKIGLVLLLVVVAVGAVLVGVRKMKDKQLADAIAPYEQVYGDNIFINDVPIAGLTPQQALERVSAAMKERVHSWSLDLTYGGWTYYTLNYPALGISFAESELYPYLNEAWALTHTGDIYQRSEAIKARAESPYQAYTTQGELNGQALNGILQQIADALYAEPLDAALLQFMPDEANPFLIRDEQVGRVLDIEAAARRILEMAGAGTSGSYELEPAIIPPKVTRADIEKTVALRAEAVTPISKDSSEDRTNNIRVAMSRINGYTLAPGEKFSFNKVVGPRTLKDGFYPALEQVSGDLVTGVGGGVCQVSTTLYQAALLSNLEILKRSIHSTPILYAEKGQDATVYLSRDREIDFVFQNTSAGTLYFTAHVERGTTKNSFITKIRIYGDSLGDQVTYRLHSVIDEVITSFDVEYKPDTEQKEVVYKDEIKLFSKAVDGYQVSTYLRKYVDGVLVDERLVSSDRYNPRPAEYWRGTTAR